MGLPIKTYVVAGDTHSGTSVMIAAHYLGGIDVLTNFSAIPETYGPLPTMMANGVRGEAFVQAMATIDPYPTFEWVGRPPAAPEDIRGKVIKQFWERILNLPKGVDNLHVVYMYRDWTARWKANPRGDGDAGNREGPEQAEIHYLRKHMDRVVAISTSDRVAAFMAYDFDWVIDNPELAMKKLYTKGWEFDPLEAAKAFKVEMRHAKRE